MRSTVHNVKPVRSLYGFSANVSAGIAWETVDELDQARDKSDFRALGGQSGARPMKVTQGSHDTAPGTEVRRDMEEKDEPSPFTDEVGDTVNNP